MAKKTLRGGALVCPLPPTMVSCGDMENSNIITIGWTGILNTIPPKTYISVRPTRHSYNIIKEKGEFVINLTPSKLVKEADYCGIYTGKKVDKFKKCSLTKVKSEKVAPPTIEESPVSLECRVFEVIHSGTHDIFMADIVNVSCNEELIDKNDRICFERAKLIAYSHGEYFALGRKLGKFGFSAAKKKKRRPVSQNQTKKSDKKEKSV